MMYLPCMLNRSSRRLISRLGAAALQMLPSLRAALIGVLRTGRGGGGIVSGCVRREGGKRK